MGNPEQSIRLRGSARTNVGQVRANNEDNVRLWAQHDFVLAIVADGMGGAAAGEEASNMAVEIVRKSLFASEQVNDDPLAALAEDEISQRLRDAITTANRAIMERADVVPKYKGMGTTVTMAFVSGVHAILGHVGDSRGYLVSGQSHLIEQVTSDHSFVEALLAAGHITEDQVDSHPMRNVLYRALGQAEDLDVDIYDLHLAVGDRLVLCSDGLTRHVRPEEIAEVVLADANPEITSQELIDLANERGGEDNVSVIVIAVEDTAETTGVEVEAVLDVAEDDETLMAKDLPDIAEALQQQAENAPNSSDEDTASIDPNAVVSELSAHPSQAPNEDIP